MIRNQLTIQRNKRNDRNKKCITNEILNTNENPRQRLNSNSIKPNAQNFDPKVIETD